MLAELGEVRVIIRARREVNGHPLCELGREISGIEIVREEALAGIERILHQYEAVFLVNLRWREISAQLRDFLRRPG